MKRKVIAAGHICLDITPVFPERMTEQNLPSLLMPGKLLHMDGVDVHTGGSVANTGLALKKLGVDVELMGKIGADAFGAIVQQIAAGYGADGLIVDPAGRTSYSVVLAVPGVDRIFLHDPGANDTFSGADIPETALNDAVLFHFGYPPLMKKMYENGGAELASIFRRMKEKGIATSLDLAAVDPAAEAGRADWEKILQNVLPYTDFFVPSFEELCFMLDREKYERLTADGGDVTTRLTMTGNVLPLAEKALQMGTAVVLVKCGTRGMLCKTAGADVLRRIGVRLKFDAGAWAAKTVVQRCFEADVVRSATGAGDTSIAAFLAAVLLGKRPAQAVSLAAAEGACAVTSYDALGGLQPLDVLEERIQTGWNTL